jgi:hypothetical protein
MSGIIAQNSGRHTGLVKASSGGGGVWNLIETLTSDGSDSDLSFTSGIDSTYDEYVFKFINIHPETDRVRLIFQANASGGSGYNETITSTHFVAYHDEAGSSSSLGYEASLDQAQGTDFQILTDSIGADNDQSVSGELWLFNPSSTVFVKHFISSFNMSHWNDYTNNPFVAGYFNTTSAIDEIQFKMSADEIQGGSISLYGIS